MALLTLNNIKASYGPIKALRGISLEVNEGEIVTLLGANGAGKTTLLMCASRIHPLEQGSIHFAGEDVSKVPGHQLITRGLVQVPEGRKIFPRLTVLENLEMGAFTRSDRDGILADREKIFELFPVLRQRITQAGGTLSGGEQQMLAIGRALMSRPKLLLMDEPSMGVAPMLVAKIFETIRLLNSEGLTVLLVEQNAHAALKLASRAYVIETGEIVLSGPACELINDPKVREAYLGEAH